MSSPPTTSRPFRAAVATAMVALIATACTPTQAADPLPNPAPSSTVASGPAPRPSPSAPRCTGAGNAAVGVFRQTVPEEVDRFEAWLGCRVDYAIDYSARESWAEISDPEYLHQAWAGEPRRLVLGIAMLPSEGDVDIARGARGDYDGHFRDLAGRLVRDGQADAILRIGWEFNLAESTWFTKDTEAFVAYWRRIVQVMRSVEGARFSYDWNPNNGRNPVDAADYYPGDDVVDFVGIDAYDVGGPYPYPDQCAADCRTGIQNRAWSEAIYGGDRGLEFWSRFAKEHGKQLSLPEWGLWSRPDGIGGGDNPVYIKKMHEFIVDPANNVGYQAYFEFDGDDGQHRLMTTFDERGKQLRSLFR